MRFLQCTYQCILMFRAIFKMILFLCIKKQIALPLVMNAPNIFLVLHQLRIFFLAQMFFFFFKADYFLPMKYLSSTLGELPANGHMYLLKFFLQKFNKSRISKHEINLLCKLIHE